MVVIRDRDSEDMILVFHVILQDHATKGLSWELLNLSCHPIKFGGHSHWGGGYNGFSLSHDLARASD